MSRVYFGEWSSATDMDLALRGLREQYEHADDSAMLAPYPLGSNPPAKVVYAASPSCTRTRRPMIVMVRGGHFHIQRRADRWSTAKVWFTEDLRRLRVAFVDEAAAVGFRELQRLAFRLELESSRFDETRCIDCAAHICGSFTICADCNTLRRIQFWRDNPIEAARMFKASLQAAR